MKLVLVTGLDGSGKSTFLDRIAEKADPATISILRLPEIESELFRNDESLFRQCEFVNYMGKRADQEGLPSLKIIAMFGAVLLFDDLYQELKANATDGTTVYCERHPFIDTLVYAQIYHKVLHPKNLDSKIGEQINRDYETELTALINRIPFSVNKTENGLCFDLLHFLYEWFSNQENNTFERMSILFPVKAPDMIYYLDAPAEILMKRIGEREQKEYHEKATFLNKMRPIYLNLFDQIQIPTKLINTTGWIEVNQVTNQILKCFDDKNQH